MNKLEKHIILEDVEFLGDIFRRYIFYSNANIKDYNIMNCFISFLEELIEDNSIKLCDTRFVPPKILSGTPSEQSNELKEVWPTMDTMLAVFPENPYYYLEWVWWNATCPIHLAELPNIEVYS